MPKTKKRTIKVVDYRSVNLAWLVAFKHKVFSKALAPEIELVVAGEVTGTGSQFEIHKGDTLCVTGETATLYTVSRPYGDVCTGEVSKSAVSFKPREEWSTEDVAEYVIKRACMEDQCTYLEMIEKPKKHVSKKKYKGTFVSQARRCRFADLVGALEYFYTVKQAAIVEQYVWLDIFSANQPKLTARNVEPAVRQENERQLTEGLHIAIANFEQRVIFMDKWDGAAPLTRAWCVWEIFGVAKATKQLEIALPESEYDRFIVTLKNEYDSIITKTSAVDVKKAQCFNPADLKAIHKAILAESSFEALDDIIKTQLRLWVASTGKLQVEKEEQKVNPDFTEIRLVANQAGRTYQAQGDFVNAESLLRKALRVAEKTSDDRERDTTVATQLNNLALVLKEQGKLKEAETLFYEALTLYERAGEEESLHYATSLNNFGSFLKAKGDVPGALYYYEEALRIRRERLGSEHADVSQSLNNTAALLTLQERFEEAQSLLEESLRIRRHVYEENHPAIATVLDNLAVVLAKQGDVDSSIQLHQESLRIRRMAHGNTHTSVAESLWNLHLVYALQGLVEESQKLRKEAFAIWTLNGVEHPEMARERRVLGLLGVASLSHQT